MTASVHHLDIVGIGEAMVQFNATKAAPLRHVATYASHVGGSELNTMIGASRLGLSTAWAGRIGHDELGELVLACARADGVDVSAVPTDPDRPTGLFIVQRGYPVAGASSSIYYRHDSAGSRFSGEDLDLDMLGRAGIVHFTGISLAVSDSLRGACFTAAERAKAAGALISFDLNDRRKLWSLEDARVHCGRALELADIVFCGLGDAQDVLGARDAEHAMSILTAHGASHVAVTMGADGAVLTARGEEVRGAPPAVEIVDATGAGDAFSATVLSGIVHGWKAQDMVDRACAVGSIVCSVVGDYEGVPTLEQLEKLTEGTWIFR